MIPDVSVVIPLRDEERNILPLHEQLTAALAPTGIPYEILLIDDGSTDATFARLTEIHARDSQLRVIQFTRNFGHLRCFANGYFPFLLQPCIFAITQNLQFGAFGLQIFGFDCEVSFLFYVVANFAARLDGLGQLGQTLSVKSILRVKVFEGSLVQSGQRNRLKFQAVFQQDFRNYVLYFLYKIDAFFMQFFHSHFGCHGAQCIDKLAFNQFL